MSDIITAVSGGQLFEASKARIMLEADFLNTMAGNVAVVGTLAPLVGVLFGVKLAIDPYLAVGVALVCFAAALGLHLAGVASLRRLEQ